VRELADRHGVAVAGTQTVGLVPRKAIEDAASREPEWKTFDGHLILEDRIASAGL
jgi:glutamate formiminotransferase